MGTAALIVFLASLVLGMAALAALVCAALGVWRTARYGYKDFRAWSVFFGEHAANLRLAFEAMGERARSIASHAAEIREGVEDIRDSAEELRSHPAIRAARLAGRLRR